MLIMTHYTSEMPNYLAIFKKNVSVLVLLKGEEVRHNPFNQDEDRRLTEGLAEKKDTYFVLFGMKWPDGSQYNLL
jgi:hypothetical protein